MDRSPHDDYFDVQDPRDMWAPALRRRVLVAENDHALRETLNQILSGAGYVVIEAEDGESALGVLEGSPIDVLILDLAMPKLDGLDLLSKISPPPPVVIIYSAFEYVTAEDVRLHVGSKVFRSLRKPVPPAHLISTVADALNELSTDERAEL